MEQGQRHFPVCSQKHSTLTHPLTKYFKILTHHYAWCNKEFEEFPTSFASSNISYFITHQIFSLARDWSKRVTWENISQLKLGNIRGYSPIFTVFLELRSRKTIRFSEQIMSADKYPSIFSRQMKAIVYYLSNSSDAGIFMRK